MKRSKHNLSHTHLLTGEMGKLIPVACVEALPGDTVQHHTNVLARVSPLAAPVMHPVTARIHHFFVPNRILWDGWEDFITGGPDGNDASSPPTVLTTATPNNLQDYFGIPPVAGIEVNALPFRAYNKIFNEYYRDQDLVTEVGQDINAVQNIAWAKDYATSARPWTQKGSQVTLPLGDTAPIQGTGGDTQVFTGSDATTRDLQIQTSSADLAATGYSGSTSNLKFTADSAEIGLETDLSNALGANINDVRRAFAIQRYQEARSRYGSRYTEYLRYLGVRPSDGRLQRPEYLGGGHTQINFSEVMQQQSGSTLDIAPSGGGSQRVQGGSYGTGDLYGHGIAAMRSNKYRRFIEEHGYIISLLSVRPTAIYQDGIHRGFLRTTKEDYFQKELQNIGQQEIYLNEVYADLANGGDTFGYNDRYMEYREHPSYVSAEYRDTLDYWHMARQFASAPTLNQSFTDCVPTKRMYNAQDNNGLWIMAQNKMVARRIVSKNAAPRIF